jgi:hypothetical protein
MRLTPRSAPLFEPQAFKVPNLSLIMSAPDTRDDPRPLRESFSYQQVPLHRFRALKPAAYPFPRVARHYHPSPESCRTLGYWFPCFPIRV